MYLLELDFNSIWFIDFVTNYKHNYYEVQVAL